MKQAKQRVIALDYFRGICILLVIINHADAFSMPFANFAGDGSLWTSAAEMFLLLSGITFAIVRGPTIITDFRNILKKTARRSLIIYAAKVLVVFLSILIALWFQAHAWAVDFDAPLPTVGGFHLIWSVLNSSYNLGWASFLMFYSVFLLFAPFALYVLRTRYWPAVPMLSLALVLYDHGMIAQNGYAVFGYWQVYFVMGLVIGRFRDEIASFSQKLYQSRLRPLRSLAILTVGVGLLISALLAFRISPYVSQLANSGWLPVKVESAYIHLLNHKIAVDNLLMNDRAGILRPFFALFVFFAVYFIYQKHSQKILERTGNFVITMGRNTLAIFIGQAFLIPILAAVEVPRTFVFNLLLTSTLILGMWLLAQAEISKTGISQYFYQLKNNFYKAKNSYLEQYKDAG